MRFVDSIHRFDLLMRFVDSIGSLDRTFILNHVVDALSTHELGFLGRLEGFLGFL